MGRVRNHLAARKALPHMLVANLHGALSMEVPWVLWDCSKSAIFKTIGSVQQKHHHVRSIHGMFIEHFSECPWVVRTSPNWVTLIQLSWHFNKQEARSSGKMQTLCCSHKSVASKQMSAAMIRVYVYMIYILRCQLRNTTYVSTYGTYNYLYRCRQPRSATRPRTFRFGGRTPRAGPCRPSTMRRSCSIAIPATPPSSRLVGGGGKPRQQPPCQRQQRFKSHCNRLRRCCDCAARTQYMQHMHAFVYACLYK